MVLAALAMVGLASLGASPHLPQRVLVVSIDALHPAALTAGTMPAVFKLAQRGRFTLLGHSTRPPKTLIAHAAMLTGLAPAQSGKTDNAWEEGQPRVQVSTVLDDARAAGYRTAFYYSKEKLGFLVGAGTQVHALAPEDGIGRTAAFLAAPGRAFVLLHLSGLEFAGMESGWLSPEYLAKANAIDRDLAPLLADLERRGDYFLVITSDHAGHGLEHGTDDPEDARLPLVVRSDRTPLPDVQGKPFEITALRAILGRVFIGGVR